MSEKLTDLQALVAGAVLGGLMKAPEAGLMIDVEPVVDDAGNYTGAIRVRGRESGEELLIVVMTEALWPPKLEVVPDD